MTPEEIEARTNDYLAGASSGWRVGVRYLFDVGNWVPFLVIYEQESGRNITLECLIPIETPPEAIRAMESAYNVGWRAGNQRGRKELQDQLCNLLGVPHAG